MSHDVEQLAHSDVRDLPRNAAAAEDDPMLGSRKSPTKCGFLSHGGTSIAGWFISVKILFKMNDLGVRYTPLLFWLNTHGLVSQTLGYGNRLKGSDI